jgi:hypothetical protein
VKSQTQYSLLNRVQKSTLPPSERTSQSQTHTLNTQTLTHTPRAMSVSSVLRADRARRINPRAPARQPTLKEILQDIVQLHSLPQDNQYVAESRSTLGILRKHLLPRRRDYLPYSVRDLPIIK